MKRYVIRDTETGEERKKFDDNSGENKIVESDSLYVAHSLLSSMNFGLKLYYEIYDRDLCKVVYKCVDSRRGRN